jgi:N-acylglucosamine-6-phosphate 2-epimerase
VKHQTVQSLCGKLVVSCQAFPGSPFYGAEFIAAFAKCAELGGAGGIRACWAENIRAVKAAVKLPVIGINKVTGGESMRPDRVYITPSFESAVAVIEAGCDILGMDMTPRGRSWSEIGALVERIKKAYPDIPVMADISTLDEGVMAEQLGADIVSTTLSGYTLASIREMDEHETLFGVYQSTGEIPEFAPDYALIAALRKRISVPINAEGRFWERADVQHGFASGASMVTVGAAITAPEAITKRLVHAIPD